MDPKSVAILSDIHGNVPAMEAVLEDLRDQAIDEVLVGGDMVGRGPQGSQVVRRIAAAGWRSVRGNHEDYLLAFRRRDVPEAWLEADEWSASRWMAAELGPDEVRYIDALPFSLRSRVAPGLRLVHGSPRSYSEGLGPWNSDAQLASHLERVEEDVLVCAHTHRPLHRRLATGHIVNTGAVGLPFNGDRRAQYAILRLDRDEWSVEFRRVEYDVERTLAIYRSSGFLEAGGVTARLLELELLHAAPYLVPFLRWAERRQQRPGAANLDAFLEEHEASRGQT